MLANVFRTGWGNELKKDVVNISLFPDGKITTGHIEIEKKESGEIKIFISKAYIDIVSINREESEVERRERLARELYNQCYANPALGEYLMHIAQNATLKKYKDEQAQLIRDANDLSFLSATMYDSLSKTKSGRSKLDFIFTKLDHAFKVLAKWMDKSEFGKQIANWIKEKENEKTS